MCPPPEPRASPRSTPAPVLSGTVLDACLHFLRYATCPALYCSGLFTFPRIVTLGFVERFPNGAPPPNIPAQLDGGERRLRHSLEGCGARAPSVLGCTSESVNVP